MAPSSSTTIVISLGGSMIVPGDIDVNFITRFIDIVRAHTERGIRFYLIVGGGKTARTYQQGLRDLGNDNQDALDWIGLYATHLNADLVRLHIGQDAHHETIKDPLNLPETDASIVVCGGWKPGWSTDYVAVTIADQVGAKNVMNLSNIAYVYSDDPRINPDAQKYTDLSWQEYINIIPKEWKPGMSAPFDPIASQKAQESGITVAMMDGHNLENIGQFLHTGEFDGTRLR